MLLLYIFFFLQILIELAYYVSGIPSFKNERLYKPNVIRDQIKKSESVFVPGAVFYVKLWSILSSALFFVFFLASASDSRVRWERVAAAVASAVKLLVLKVCAPQLVLALVPTNIGIL